MNAAYAPPRDPRARIARRLTQWRAARPATLALERPLLTISFDDFPVSAARAGAAVLEGHGVRGSYFAAAGLMGEEGACGRNFSAEDLLALAARDHEIGCHSFAHDDAARHAPCDTLADYAKNADAIAALGHTKPLTTLAYPYGETRFALKQQLPDRIRVARGILAGLNEGRIDLAQLRAFPLFGADAAERLAPTLARAAKHKAWMIVFTHDISDAPSPFGTTARALNTLIARAKALNFDILPLGAAHDIAFKETRACAA
jgi:peptidoglycan/xylan/chitin deacetylase (PgdA/CDA1 family)